MAPWLNVFNVLPETVNPSVPTLSNVVVLSSFQRKGVIIMAVAALTSCTFVSVLLLYIAASALSSWWQPKPDSPIPFIRRQIAVFVVCLLIADLVQSISGVFQLKWALENRIYEGIACTAQAVTVTMGDLGSTVWSCVIAAHTFSTIALGKQWSRSTVLATVIVGWSFVMILTLIGPIAFETPEKGPFFGIAGGWCFIQSHYAIHRLVIYYVPLFVATVLIPLFYGLVFLVLRGSISFVRHRTRAFSMSGEDDHPRERMIIAKRMLWYPIAYLTCILPISIIRLVDLKEDHIPDSVWTFGVAILFLLGAIDSVIYATTRKLVKPINFSRPLHRPCSDFGAHSDIKLQRSSRKPGIEDFARADVHRSLDRLPYVAWGKEYPRQLRGSPYEHETRPCIAAIRVTLERFEEVR